MYDSAVTPAQYVAQQPREPLGFTASRFEPQPSSNVVPQARATAPVEEAEQGYEQVYDEPYDEPIVYDGLPPVEPFATPEFGTSGEWLRNGFWYADASVVYFDLTTNVRNNVPLSAEFFPGSTVQIDNLTVQQDLGYQPGLLFSLGRYLGRDTRNRDHSVEFSFMGLTHWQHAKTLTASTPGTIFLLLDPLASVPVYQGSDSQGYDLTADLNSYELNYRLERRLGRDRLVYSRDNSWVRQATPALLCTVFGGVRSVILNERLNWFATSVDGTGNYNVVTHNNMVGPQAGAELFFERAYWRVGVRAKGGSLVNFASQGTTVRILDTNGDPLTPNRDTFAKTNSMSFVGGLTFIGEYRFTPNFGVRGACDLMWVTSQALAQNQLTFFPSTPAQISASHTLFLNGFSLGLEWHH